MIFDTFKIICSNSEKVFLMLNIIVKITLYNCNSLNTLTPKVNAPRYAKDTPNQDSSNNIPDNFVTACNIRGSSSSLLSGSTVNGSSCTLPAGGDGSIKSFQQQVLSLRQK